MQGLRIIGSPAGAFRRLFQVYFGGSGRLVNPSTSFGGLSAKPSVTCYSRMLPASKTLFRVPHSQDRSGLTLRMYTGPDGGGRPGQESVVGANCKKQRFQHG